MTMRGPLASIALVALLLPSGAGARADTLEDLANAELHLADVCPAGATIGIYGTPELVGSLTTDVFQLGDDVTLVERERLDDLLAEFALTPFLDPATAPVPGQFVMAKFIVLAEIDLSSLPADLSVSMIRTDTQEVVYEHTSVITEADGFDGLQATLDEIAQALASIAAGANYACPRLGSLSYTAAMSGNDWGWDVSGYFDVLIRPSGPAGALEAIVRHVPTGSQVSGLLLSATGTQFPVLPGMSVMPQATDPQGEPTSYLIQFPNLGAIAPSHTLVFDEPPNPVFNTGRQNEQEFPNVGAVALGQWMRRNGNPALQLDAAVTGDMPDTWTVPAGQGMMTLTWVLP